MNWLRKRILNWLSMKSDPYDEVVRSSEPLPYSDRNKVSGFADFRVAVHKADNGHFIEYISVGIDTGRNSSNGQVVAAMYKPNHDVVETRNFILVPEGEDIAKHIAVALIKGRIL